MSNMGCETYECSFRLSESDDDGFQISNSFLTLATFSYNQTIVGLK